jgi:hypothetical protein
MKASEICVVFAAFLGRRDVAEHHIGSDRQTTGPAALDDPTENQREHVRRSGADQRAGHIDRDTDQHGGPAAVDVREFSVERGERSRGDKKRGDQPRQVVHVAKVAPDGRQRTGQD